ncbi:M20/M25/M40 family metallo-hydrolase [Schaalia canis]|uniref:Dipeptidase n=1 Tax=Schaalia canis TaxID=100469 RepID=A0A3P1SGA6_9ACTO|nr:M20/M25/M40 family metallo-hydrolase [Schaalia canis]RRC96323.1 dipeptidase [Schaalia canis]
MTHQTLTTDTIRERVEAAFPALLNELIQLVAIPSVSSAPEHAADLQASAEHVRDRFAALGLDADIYSVTTPEGIEGKPAVVAHTPRIDGAPTVLLYAHHDIQPVGDVGRWASDPYTAEVRGDRLYGRGTSDDGAGIIVHLGALTVLAQDLGVNVTVFIEGEEELGSPSFVTFLETYREQLEADVIVVADSDNWKVGEPALTSSLRGNCVCTVDVTIADHAVHSGMFGGPILDSNIIACELIATLHDAAGDVAVAGLGGNPHADVDWPEEEFRQAAGVLDSYQLAGTADLAARMWTMPAISVIGFDATPVEKASNTISPHTRFRLSMRTVPGVEPKDAMDALVAHLESHAPRGAQVVVTPNEYGPGYQADLDSEVTALLHEVLTEAWGVPSVNIGVGGSIPFISDFQRVFPSAQVVVTGVEDPMTNAHSEDESQSIPDLKAAIVAESLLLARLAN